MEQKEHRGAQTMSLTSFVFRIIRRSFASDESLLKEHKPFIEGVDDTTLPQRIAKAERGIARWYLVWLLLLPFLLAGLLELSVYLRMDPKIPTHLGVHVMSILTGWFVSTIICFFVQRRFLPRYSERLGLKQIAEDYPDYHSVFK